MTDPLLIATARLARVLEQENAALAALDLPGAARLLGEKQEAARLFAAAGQDAAAGTEAPALAGLRDLAGRNRRLLERAIAVQGEVIGLIAGALPKANPGGRYAASGAPARNGPSVAYALLARA